MKLLKSILLGALFVIVQITVLNLVTIKTIKPDLVVLFIISRALATGPTYGVIWGFSLGLALDTISGGLTGLAALTYSLVGFICGHLGTQKVLSRSRYLGFVALGCALSTGIFSYFNQPWDSGGWLRLILTHSLPSLFYTWTVALIWIHSPFAHLPTERSFGE